MPSSIIPALIEIPGPAFILTRNVAIYAKGNITVRDNLATFDIDSAQVGKVEEREASRTLSINFTPVGKLSGALTVLWPYGNVKPGNLVHAAAKIVSVDTGTEIATFDALARFRDGAPVRLGTRGTVPTGLTAGTLYFLHKLSSTTGTLHTTEANALAASSPVNLTGAGTGDSFICEEEYLIVWGFNGDKYTFWNTALVGVPDFNGSAGATAIGEVTFEAFRKFGTLATDAASFYTQATSSPTDTTMDPSAIVTEAYDFTWGSSAPWSGMQTKGGINAKFPLQLTEVMDDVNGIISRRITGLDCVVTARPLNVTRADLLAKLVPQNTGAGRGRRLALTDPLNIISTTTDSFYLRLYGAMVKAGPINHDKLEEPVGELTWSAGRTYTTGVANALYGVGINAAALV